MRSAWISMAKWCRRTSGSAATSREDGSWSGLLMRHRARPGSSLRS
jgi:hypothetical protein